MALTKYRLDNDTILRMAEAAFPGRSTPLIEELTEGMCNTSYKLTYDDGFKTVLKVSSPDTSCFLTNECRLMDAEVKAMQLVAANTDIRVAKVYRHDTSRTLCGADYFFMECLDGDSWVSVYGSLSEETVTSLSRQTGALQRKLTAVKGSHFGMLGDDEHTFEHLYDFVRMLIANVLDDAARRDVDIGVPHEDILRALEADRALFDAVRTPTLVHWDMWVGNIFIHDGHITGIIDWERAMWGEPFMDDRFRGHSRNDNFLAGFGADTLSPEELRRIDWYDMLLYLTMITEATYRAYETDEQVRWTRPLLEKTWARLNA